MTIYDISKKAGVSIATVSRVLNGSENVSDKTKKKVLSVMQECGYTPNAFARGLGLNTMKTAGILCADSSDIYLAKAVYYLESKLRENGYNSILCCTGYDASNKQSCMELLLSRKVDAIILTGSNFVEADEEKNEYIRNAAARVPVMLLNAEFDCPGVYSILCDDQLSTCNATVEMLREGWRFPVYLYNSHTFSARQKLAGFRKALSLHPELTEQSFELFFPGSHDDIDAVAAFLDSCEEMKQPVNGIVTSEDGLAVGALKYALKKGLRVGQDLAVIGYNNSILSTCCEPELSSIDNHLEKLCTQLVKILFDVMAGEAVPPKSVFYGSLVRRLSF